MKLYGHIPDPALKNNPQFMACLNQIDGPSPVRYLNSKLRGRLAHGKEYHHSHVTAILHDEFGKEAAHCKRGNKNIADLIVVNEAFDRAGRLKNNQMQEVFGSDWIRIAFEVARQHFPNSRLWINDCHYRNDAKWTAIETYLTENKVDCQGIGVQYHAALNGYGPAPSSLVRYASGHFVRRRLRYFARIGFRTCLSEITFWPAERPTLKQIEAMVLAYKSALRMGEACGADFGVLWSVSDNQAWSFGNISGPCGLWDLDYKPKFKGNLIPADRRARNGWVE